MLGCTAAVTLAGGAAGEDGWELTAAAGLSYADGNADSAAYSVQVLASYLDDENEAYLGADYFYAEDGGAASTDRMKVFGQYNRDLRGRWYLGGFGSWSRDDVAGLDYRVDANVLLGYRAIEGERAKLSFEAGPGYAWERQGAMSRNFATLRLAERFDYQLNGTTKLWQSLAWTPKVEDLSDHVIDLEAGLETRLTERWSLRTFVRHRIDSTPAAGRGRSDTSLIAGVAFDLSGLAEAESGGGRRSLMPGGDEKSDPKKGWSSVAALGLSMNKGNADSLGYNLSWNSAYRGERKEFFFDLAHAFAENNGATANDRTQSRVQFNRFLSERVFLGASTTYLRDGAADIDYRIIPGVLAGYALIKSDATNLSLEAGPSYSFEKVGRTSSDYTSAMAAQRFSHAFNDRVSFKQAVVWTAEVSDFEHFNVTAMAALDTKIGSRMIWRLGADYVWENQPAALRGHHDLTLTSAMAVKF